MPNFSFLDATVLPGQTDRQILICINKILRNTFLKQTITEMCTFLKKEMKMKSIGSQLTTSLFIIVLIEQSSWERGFREQLFITTDMNHSHGLVQTPWANAYQRGNNKHVIFTVILTPSVSISELNAVSNFAIRQLKCLLLNINWFIKIWITILQFICT